MQTKSLSERPLFLLTLANEQAWSFTADALLRGWLERFGQMMKLRRARADNSWTAQFLALPEFASFRSDAFTKTSMIEQDLRQGLRIGQEENVSWTHSAPEGDPRQAAVTIMRSSANGDVIFHLSPMYGNGIGIQHMWHCLVPVYCRAELSGGLALHGGLVIINGEGFLILGASGSGKSTCISMIRPPWRALCDDEVLVVKAASGKYVAHPFPTWSALQGSTTPRSWNVQEYVSLKALFFVEKGAKTELRPVGSGKTAALLSALSEQLWSRTEDQVSAREMRCRRERTFRNSCAIARSLPGYMLRFSKNRPPWTEVAEWSGNS